MSLPMDTYTLWPLQCTPKVDLNCQELSINARQLGLPQKCPYLPSPTLSAVLPPLSPLSHGFRCNALSLALPRYCQEIEAGTI